MYSLPNLRSSKDRGAFPRRKPCTSTFCTSLRYALSEAFSSSSQLSSTSRTASLVGNFSTETFTFPPTRVFRSNRNSSGDTPLNGFLERETGIEPATFSLARRCSTTEPLPLDCEPTLISYNQVAVNGGR